MYAAVLRAAALLQPLLDDDVAGPADRSELAALLPLLGLERFNRRAVNRALARLTEKQFALEWIAATTIGFSEVQSTGALVAKISATTRIEPPTLVEGEDGSGWLSGRATGWTMT